MDILAFLLGLFVGGGLVIWRQLRLEVDLRQTLRRLDSGTTSSSLPSLSRLLSLVARQQEQIRSLQQGIATWKQVLDYSPVGYLQVDEDSQLTWCNSAASQILGFQQSVKSRPRLLLELVRSYELDHLIEETRSAQHSCCHDWIYYPVCATPESPTKLTPLALRGFSVPLEAGSVGVFLENRQEIVTLSHQGDRWISDVAHELKTPLTSIRLVAETLQGRLRLPLRGWVDRLLDEVIRLSNLVQDLLELSHLEAGREPGLKLTAVNLPELVQSAWVNLEPLAHKKQVRLNYLGPNTLVIQADERRLYRVLINLLDNGIKYSPPRQQIQLILQCQTVRRGNPDDSPRADCCTPPEKNSPPDQSAQSAPQPIGSQDWISNGTSQIFKRNSRNTYLQPTNSESNESNDWVRLEVIDAGLGFPEDTLPHVFERFYRADPARSRRDVSHVSSQQAMPEIPEQHQELESLEKGLPAGAYQSTDTSVSEAAQERKESYQSGSSGLGLAIVRQIVEAHQGYVIAGNHPETGGAWLQVWLPADLSATTDEPLT